MLLLILNCTWQRIMVKIPFKFKSRLSEEAAAKL